MIRIGLRAWRLGVVAAVCACAPCAMCGQASVPGGDLGVVGDAPVQAGSLAAQTPDVQAIFELTNQDRAAQGVGALAWSPALAAAAGAHAQAMAANGALSHRYPDEADLATRAAGAGARFSRIAENIAQGGGARAIEKEWMTSVPHRQNILDPSMTAIGVAVVAERGTLYAVEDFAQAQEMLSSAQVEARVAALLASGRPTGVAPLGLHAPQEARGECVRTDGLAEGSAARFILRFESAEVVLPRPLIDAVASGRYTGVGIGACAPVEQANRGFAVYRVAVLLY